MIDIKSLPCVLAKSSFQDDKRVIVIFRDSPVTNNEEPVPSWTVRNSLNQSIQGTIDFSSSLKWVDISDAFKNEGGIYLCTYRYVNSRFNFITGTNPMEI